MTQLRPCRRLKSRLRNQQGPPGPHYADPAGERLPAEAKTSSAAGWVKAPGVPHQNFGSVAQSEESAHCPPGTTPGVGRESAGNAAGRIHQNVPVAAGSGCTASLIGREGDMVAGEGRSSVARAPA